MNTEAVAQPLSLMQATVWGGALKVILAFVFSLGKTSFGGIEFPDAEMQVRIVTVYLQSTEVVLPT